MGYSSLEDFLVGFWEGFFLDRRDPNNLLSMLWTWQNGNIGLTEGFDGSVEKALASIRAKARQPRRRRLHRLVRAGRPGGWGADQRGRRRLRTRREADRRPRLDRRDQPVNRTPGLRE